MIYFSDSPLISVCFSILTFCEIDESTWNANSGSFLVTDMAQTMFQVSGLRYDPEYAHIQGFQQTAVLRGVSKHYTALYLILPLLLGSLTKPAFHFIAERKVTRENCCRHREPNCACRFCRITNCFT